MMWEGEGAERPAGSLPGGRAFPLLWVLAVMSGLGSQGQLS